MMKSKWLLGLLAASLLSLPAVAQPFVKIYNFDAKAPVSTTNPLPVTTTPSSVVTQATVTNLTASVPNSSTAVTLVASSTHVCIKTDPTAAVLYVDLANGTATSADFRIEPGGALTCDNLPAMTTFKIIGASATGTYSVAAW